MQIPIKLDANIYFRTLCKDRNFFDAIKHSRKVENTTETMCQIEIMSITIFCSKKSRCKANGLNITCFKIGNTGFPKSIYISYYYQLNSL